MDNETMNNEQAAAVAPQSEIRNQKSKIVLGWVAAWVVLFGLLALVAVKLYQITLGPISSGGAPDFTLSTFDGGSLTLSKLRGQVVIVNFWASWCKPCEQEAAELEAFYRANKDRGVLLIGVDYVDTETEARGFLLRYGISYPNGPDLGTRISQAYRIKGVPETYIVDKNGQLARTLIGPTTQATLQAIVEPLLK